MKTTASGVGSSSSKEFPKQGRQFAIDPFLSTNCQIVRNSCIAQIYPRQYIKALQVHCSNSLRLCELDSTNRGAMGRKT